MSANLREQQPRSVLRPVLLTYYCLALTCSPLNRLLLGDLGAAVSVSYLPLIVLLAAYSVQLVRRTLDPVLGFLFGGLALVVAISIGHSVSSFDPFLVKCPLFFLFTVLVAVNTTDSDIRAVTKATYICAGAYIFIGLPLWYTNVYGEILTPASFSEAMFFQKQDYTVVLTIVAGMLLYELLLSESAVVRRRYLVALQLGAIAIGITFFYIKSLLVVIAFSIITLWLFGVRRARKHVVGMVASVIFLYLTYERLILLGWFPEHIVAYVAWLFDDRFVSVEGARNLDTLTMRLMILADNVDAMRQGVGHMLFGIGTNAAAEASFTSYLSGRERDLPIEMESGILQVFVYLGSVGLVIYLLPYLYGFKAWMNARRQYLPRSTAIFSRVVAVNLALLASNIFQDNLASVTWYWLGLLWYCVLGYRRAERVALQSQSVVYGRPARGISGRPVL